MAPELNHFQRENDMRKKILNAVAVALLSSVSVAALAQGKAGEGPNPYTDCGIGAALFGDTHWAAVTSNVIWDLGSTAITSATLSPQTCSGKKIKAALFIRDTYEQLAEEVARGKGEHVASALDMFQCGTGREAAAAEVRNVLGRAAAEADYAQQPHLERAGRLYNIFESAARNSCSA